MTINDNWLSLTILNTPARLLLLLSNFIQTIPPPNLSNIPGRQFRLSRVVIFY